MKTFRMDGNDTFKGNVKTKSCIKKKKNMIK